MERFRYVIIGGGLAAGRAAQGIRAHDSGGSVAMICGEQHAPYHRPNLSKGYLRGQDSRSKIDVQSESAYGEQSIKLFKGARAASLDVSDKRVYLDDGREVGYNKLLLATGGTARRLSVPGSHMPNVFVLRTVDDADMIRCAAQPGSRAVVIGGSFIGSEVAASLAQLGAQVTMVYLEGRPLGNVVGPPFSHLVTERFEQAKIRMLPQTSVERIEGDNVVQRVIVSSGQVIPADLVVMGVGISLNTAIAQRAGLELSEQGAIVVDEHLETSESDIFAAGDIAQWPEPSLERRMRVEHWDVAYNQGYFAGANMTGQAQAYDVLPYFFTDLFEISAEMWGDPRGDDQVIQRGDWSAGTGQALFHFREGVLQAGLVTRLSDADRNAVPALIKARVRRQDVAERIARADQPLSDILGAELMAGKS